MILIKICIHIKNINSSKSEYGQFSWLQLYLLIAAIPKSRLPVVGCVERDARVCDEEGVRQAQHAHGPVEVRDHGHAAIWGL